MAEVEELLKQLHKHEVKFVLVGGMAAVAQGSAYLTADIDLCYSRDPENLKKLAEAIAAFNPRLRGASFDLPF